MDNSNTKIEIVSGDGDDLDISPVYEHLPSLKPNCNNKPQNIVIPKTKKSKKEDEDE